MVRRHPGVAVAKECRAAAVDDAAGARTGHTNALSIGCGLLYVAAVLGLAELWSRRSGPGRWRGLSLVNGVGGAVASRSSRRHR